MSTTKICKLSEDRDLKFALQKFLEEANAINMEVAGVLGSYSRKYKFAGRFYPDKPKTGTLKGEVLCDEGDYDRALLHAELWLNTHPAKQVFCTITVLCYSYKIIAFWKEYC